MDIKAYIEIARPKNSILASFVSFLGSFVATLGLPEPKPVLLAGLIVFLETSAGNSINDYFDYEIDKINRPNRPIPSGRISKKNAKIFYLLLVLTGISIAFLVNKYIVFMSILASIALYTYSWKLKGTPFFGNFIVALMTGLVPIFGGLAVEEIGLVYYMALSAFLVNLSREIYKDIEDIEGDRQKAKTLPITIGKRKSFILALIFLLLTILSTFLPLRSAIGRGYWFMVIPDFILLRNAVKSILVLNTENYIEGAGKIQKQLKIAIPIALFTYLLGSITF